MQKRFREKFKKVCPICQKEFIVHSYRKNIAKFCSKKCVAKGCKNGFKKGHPEYRKPKENPKYKNENRDKHGNHLDRKWRMEVFARDNFTCQICQKIGGKLEAHHIKRWAKHPELRYELSNGITLCQDCHKLTDNYGNKKTID